MEHPEKTLCEVQFAGAQAGDMGKQAWEKLQCGAVNGNAGVNPGRWLASHGSTQDEAKAVAGAVIEVKWPGEVSWSQPIRLSRMECQHGAGNGNPSGKIRMLLP
jgi:hypothetical protein